MIIKVQISLFNSEGDKMVLAYNKNKSFWYEGSATEEVIKAMNGASKKYFKATVDKRRFQLHSETKPQNW